MTVSSTSNNHWLKNVQEECRGFVKESALFTAISAASSPADFQWIRQLYYLSSDFTAAVALRYGSCQDPSFRDAFGEHSAEETTHPAELAEWMREFGFLKAGEEPTSAPPSVETLALGSYLIRVVVREPIPHQALTLNLLSEGTACDFYSAMSPKLAELGLTPKGYWAAHVKADIRHEVLGLDLIPQCDADSPCGKSYTRALWTASRFFRMAFDSWGRGQSEQMLSPPVQLY